MKDRAEIKNYDDVDMGWTDDYIDCTRAKILQKVLLDDDSDVVQHTNSWS